MNDTLKNYIKKYLSDDDILYAKKESGANYNKKHKILYFASIGDVGSLYLIMNQICDKCYGVTNWCRCLHKISICDEAARYGHINVLKWLRNPKNPFGIFSWGASTCYSATKYGKLETLKWLRDFDRGESICPWNGGHCYQIAKYNNDKKMLQWIDRHAARLRFGPY